MIEVVMPQMGESLAEGTLVRWLKAVGDRVERDEPLFEISTDKVDTDVPAPAAGTLKERLVAEGQTVAVGAAVAMIETEEEATGAAPPTAAAAAPATTPAAAPLEAGKDEPGGHFRSTHTPQLVDFRKKKAVEYRMSNVEYRESGTPAPSQSPVPSSPPSPQSPVPSSRSYSIPVLDEAKRGGLGLDDLAAMRGSGRGGRVTKRDVQRYLAAQADGRRAGRPAPGEVRERTAPPPEYLYHPKPGDRVVPMSPVRKRIADHMSWSARISPHATAFAECDMQRAADLLSARRTAFLAEAGAPLTYTVLIAHQVLGALRDFPVLNSSVVGDAIVYKPSIHLGVAVALPDSDELIVPVVHDADTLSLEGLARAIADKSTRARDHRLRPEDVQGGTFTLTNPGVFGGIGGTPIINQPQVAIVGLGGITQRPVVVEDGIAVHAMMTMTLTFDHRAADGMQAFRFLAAVKTRLEEIGRVT